MSTRRSLKRSANSSRVTTTDADTYVSQDVTEGRVDFNGLGINTAGNYQLRFTLYDEHDLVMATAAGDNYFYEARVCTEWYSVRHPAHLVYSGSRWQHCGEYLWRNGDCFIAKWTWRIISSLFGRGWIRSSRQRWTCNIRGVLPRRSAAPWNFRSIFLQIWISKVH